MKNNKKKGMYRNLALITQVGLNVIIPILLGVYIGRWLDEKFNKTMFFTMVLLIIGTLSGFMNLFKLVDRKDVKKNGKKDDEYDNKD